MISYQLNAPFCIKSESESTLYLLMCGVNLFQNNKIPSVNENLIKISIVLVWGLPLAPSTAMWEKPKSCKFQTRMCGMWSTYGENWMKFLSVQNHLNQRFHIVLSGYDQELFIGIQYAFNGGDTDELWYVIFNLDSYLNND